MWTTHPGGAVTPPSLLILCTSKYKMFDIFDSTVLLDHNKSWQHVCPTTQLLPEESGGRCEGMERLKGYEGVEKQRNKDREG